MRYEVSVSTPACLLPSHQRLTPKYAAVPYFYRNIVFVETRPNSNSDCFMHVALRLTAVELRRIVQPPSEVCPGLLVN